VLGMLFALRWLQADQSKAPAGLFRSIVGLIDLPGVAVFSFALGSLLAFLLSLSTGPRWVLLPVAPISAVLLVWWELRARMLFLNVRMLASGRGLMGVYVQFTTVNLLFYSVFFSLPLWLEKVRGVGPGETGLIVMPLTGVGVLATVVAARLTRRWGPRPPLALGPRCSALGLCSSSSCSWSHRWPASWSLWPCSGCPMAC